MHVKISAYVLDAARICTVLATIVVNLPRAPTDQEVVGDLLNQLRLIRTRALYEGWPEVRPSTGQPLPSQWL